VHQKHPPAKTALSIPELSDINLLRNAYAALHNHISGHKHLMSAKLKLFCAPIASVKRRV
jgi:hypothetical protein